MLEISLGLVIGLCSLVVGGAVGLLLALIFIFSNPFIEAKETAKAMNMMVKKYLNGINWIGKHYCSACGKEVTNDEAFYWLRVGTVNLKFDKTCYEELKVLQKDAEEGHTKW